MQAKISPIRSTSSSVTEAYSPEEVFVCPEESQLYSQCLEKVLLHYATPFDRIIEFGTGDGSPVINALLKTHFQGSIHGYELNPSACKAAQVKINQYHLQKHYLIHNKCFFSASPSQAKVLIANPPYLPAPDNQLYMPSLHGGSDGATITNQLLEIGCENVMLMISAYSNPVGTINHALNLGYKVIDFTIAPLQFGYYSSEPKVQNAIAILRQQQKAFYSQNIYFLAGVLFQKATPNNTDLSSEFLKVMTAL